ncbi:hypothetical protein WJX74_010406 [Apatococcus lobatus]|uniref:Uncharacterized protein n=1 Tax=Apatococcus lobatus TaxID=904363 RepID=A0AAW1QL16_9CHLO
MESSVEAPPSGRNAPPLEGNNRQVSQGLHQPRGAAPTCAQGWKVLSLSNLGSNSGFGCLRPAVKKSSATDWTPAERYTHKYPAQNGKQQQSAQQDQAEAQGEPQADGHMAQHESTSAASQVQGPSTPTQSCPPQVIHHLHQPNSSPTEQQTPSNATRPEQQPTSHARHDQRQDGITSSVPAVADPGLGDSIPSADHEALAPQQGQAEDIHAEHMLSQPAGDTDGQAGAQYGRYRPLKSKQAANKTGLPALEAAGQRLAELQAVQQAKDAHKQRQRAMLARSRSSRKLDGTHAQPSSMSDFNPTSPHTSRLETSLGATGDITLSQDCFESESGAGSLRALQAERARALLATTFHSFDQHSNPLLTSVNDGEGMLGTLSTFEEEPHGVTASHTPDGHPAARSLDGQPNPQHQEAMSPATSLQGAQEIAAADARLMETGDLSSWQWDMQQLISSEAQAKAVLEQQAQDLEGTMQQMVHKDRELHEQQNIADHLRKQLAADPVNQSPELRGDAARAAGMVQACKQEYAQLEIQADRKARMVRYLSHQVQERSEDVREAQQLLTTQGTHDAAERTVRERAARPDRAAKLEQEQASHRPAQSQMPAQVEQRASSLGCMSQRLLQTEGQIDMLEANLAEARGDATAKCREALSRIIAESQSIQAAMSPLLKGSKLRRFEPVHNATHGHPALHGSILISQAQEAVEVLKSNVESLIVELEQRTQGMNSKIGQKVGQDAETQTDTQFHMLQLELEGKSLAFTAQGHRLAAAQQQVHQLTVDLQHVHTELQLKQHQLAQLTTDHILEAERVGQACSDAAVMAQQIDALMAEAGVRKLELAQARSDASCKADQVQMWKQQASKEAVKVNSLEKEVLMVRGLLGEQQGFVQSRQSQLEQQAARINVLEQQLQDTTEALEDESTHHQADMTSIHQKLLHLTSSMQAGALQADMQAATEAFWQIMQVQAAVVEDLQKQNEDVARGGCPNIRSTPQAHASAGLTFAQVQQRRHSFRI